MARPLDSYEVLTFDCYGTLIDWETGLWNALQPLLAAQEGAVPDRQAALQAYAGREHAVESAHPALPYEQVLAQAHAALAVELGLATTPALDDAFGASVPAWPPFADSGDALRRLQQRYKLVILSNVSEAGIAASADALGVTFDAIYTAEAIGSYKPDPRNFEVMLANVARDFGVAKDGILHVAQSLFHDHVPARALGIANAWIDRQRLSEGGAFGATAPVAERPTVDYLYFTLAELADAAGL